MDIARPASVLKKKKIRRAVVAAAAIIVVALVTVVLAQLKPAAPTVERGTTWTTKDTCSSTTTSVTAGSVAVRDFARRKTIIVRAGKTYVARARRR